MLKLLSRVTAPTEGEIDIYGRIASMLEVGTGFNGEMTGRENVYLNGAILGMTKAEIDAKMEQIIEFSEVREFIDTPVKRYSSGMYVKLAFSVAAHLDSEIMIMDEVLAVGDMAFQKKCLDKMRDAAKQEGRTVLYVSHNMNTIRQLCDRCVVLDKGKVVFEGNTEEAIQIYMGSTVQTQAFYAYEKQHHASNRSNGQFIIKSLSIPQNEKGFLECGEAILLDLTCYSQIERPAVYFRFEIQYQDGTVVASMLSDTAVSFKKNEEKRISMRLDTAHLVYGEYRIDIVAFIKNEFGNEQFLDGVYPGMKISLSSPSENESLLVWSCQYWGHVRLHDVIIVK